MTIEIKHKGTDVFINLDYKGSYVDVKPFLIEVIGSTIDKINETPKQ